MPFPNCSNKKFISSLIQRTIPSCDIKSYITKAQNATDTKIKFEILDEIIKEFPANLVSFSLFGENTQIHFGYIEKHAIHVAPPPPTCVKFHSLRNIFHFILPIKFACLFDMVLG